MGLYKDTQRQFWRYDGDASKVPEQPLWWPALRDSAGNVVRDSATAFRIKRRYDAMARRNQAKALWVPNPNASSYRASEAMDAYFQGVSLERSGKPAAARESFRTALQRDSTLGYESDIFLWMASSYRSEGFEDSARAMHHRFRDRSVGLCPASANIRGCEDASRYAAALDSLGGFLKLRDDSLYFAAAYSRAPNMERNHYGSRLPAKPGFQLDLFLSTASGGGALGLFEYPIAQRFNPFVFSLISSGGSAVGGGLQTTLLQDKYNEYGLKLKTYAFGRSGRSEGRDIDFWEPMIGLEGYRSISRRWMLFASASKYYYDQTEPYVIHADSVRLRVWKSSYVNFGTTWFFTNDFGITMRSFNAAPQAGLQWGSAFIGVDFEKSWLIVSTRFLEDIF